MRDSWVKHAIFQPFCRSNHPQQSCCLLLNKEHAACVYCWKEWSLSLSQIRDTTYHQVRTSLKLKYSSCMLMWETQWWSQSLLKWNSLLPQLTCGLAKPSILTSAWQFTLLTLHGITLETLETVPLFEDHSGQNTFVDVLGNCHLDIAKLVATTTDSGLKFVAAFNS